MIANNSLSNHKMKSAEKARMRMMFPVDILAQGIAIHFPFNANCSSIHLMTIFFFLSIGNIWPSVKHFYQNSNNLFWSILFGNKIHKGGHFEEWSRK